MWLLCLHNGPMFGYVTPENRYQLIGSVKCSWQSVSLRFCSAPLEAAKIPTKQQIGSLVWNCPHVSGGQLETEAAAVFVCSYPWQCQAVILWSFQSILGALVLCHC